MARPSLVRAGVTVCALMTLALPSDAGAAGAHISELEGDPQAGYVTVYWQAETDGPCEYELQLAGPGGDFETWYTGPQRASFLSGLTDGQHRFRVRERAPTAAAPWSAWSPEKRFDVAHHSLALALSMLGLGALVAAATIITLLRADRRQAAAAAGRKAA